MDYIQQNLHTDFFNKLKPTLGNFPSHQFNSPVLCLKAFIQDGDSLMMMALKKPIGVLRG
jgi:hypothetical protein